MGGGGGPCKNNATCIWTQESILVKPTSLSQRGKEFGIGVITICECYLGSKLDLEIWCCTHICGEV